MRRNDECPPVARRTFEARWISSASQSTSLLRSLSLSSFASGGGISPLLSTA
jgi:hypothetical protein